MAFAWLAATLGASSISLATDAHPELLAKKLKQQVARARKVARDVGVHVVDLASGTTVFEDGADRLLIPASNQKLMTTAAALHHLGAAYQFETPILYQGILHKGVLVGDLAVVAGGDPNLSARHYDEQPILFRTWAERLAAQGLRRVTGRLFLVLDQFETTPIHPAWPTDQLDRCYEAPVTGLDYSDNCLVVRIWPGSAPGKPPFVEIEPADFFGPVRNQAVTAARGRTTLRIDYDPDDGALAISGQIARGSVERYVAVLEPARFFGHALGLALRHAGIIVDGEPERIIELPSGIWRPLGAHSSDLVTAIEVTNKHSHNFSAESLFKTLGSELCGSGSWSGGQRAVSDFLVDVVGWPAGAFRVSDGSGMSRENQTTARQLTTLLAFMVTHPESAVFARSLPVSGEAGTSLEERLEEPPYAGNVLAKTGSLTGVSSLSGYAKGGSGHLYAFSILMNRASVWRSRQAQDRIVATLVDDG